MATQASVIAVSDFGPRLKVLKQLQKEAKEAYHVATESILRFAIEYTALYKDYARNTALVQRLNNTLDLGDWEATRLRTIAAQGPRLKAIQKALPPSLEPMYKVARSLKRNEKKVLKAVDNGDLTPSSTMREIRNIGKKRADSQVPPARPTIHIDALKSLEMTFLVPRDTVLRPDDIQVLGEAIAKVLSKYKARYVGLSNTTLLQHLEAYWHFKDEAATLRESGTPEPKADLAERWSAMFDGGEVWS